MQNPAILALIISIIGILALSIFLIMPINTIKLTNQSIDSLEVNQRVLVEGKVTSQNQNTLKVDNFSIYCQNCPNYVNKSISIESAVTEYYNSKSLQALKVRIIK